METCRNDTIGAFNAYVDKLREENPKATLSLTMFDTGGTDLVYDNVKIDLVGKMTRETFVPRGGTNLYDAIGKSIDHLDKVKSKLKSLVILTDGEENSSREHSASSIKAMVTDRQENKNWLIQYLGANQDAVYAGSKFGVLTSNAIGYSTNNMLETFGASVASTMRYAKSGGSLRASAFTDEERNSVK